ncbi:MAG: YitT family protein [Ruminococcaceae bacterium]|nr:YitT family protein [Oscillospiraceae bacterium]
MKERSKFKDFLVMTLGSLLVAFGVYFFKIPNGFATGGVTGIGTILAKITPISAGIWIWGLNIVLLIIGFIFLGRGNGIKTVYCSMFYSAVTYLLEIVVPLNAPLTNQPLLELVYAMLLTSIGAAMIFNVDASSGGTDIAALILKKYTSIDVGKALLVVDFLVASSSFIIFNVQTGLFSLLGLFSKAFIVDGVIENLNVCKYFIVITEKREEISRYIIENLHHGVTASVVTGEFTNEEKVMLHTVCKRIEAVRLRKEIKNIDPHAFVIITSSSEIIGRGFRDI